MIDTDRLYDRYDRLYSVVDALFTNNNIFITFFDTNRKKHNFCKTFRKHVSGCLEQDFTIF